jgi:CheY-like chemotaxis protein
MKKRKILVVDDEPLNITLLCEMLGRNQFDLITAGNGNDAVSLAKDETPDLIILDWQMPEMDGLEALRVLKTKPETEDIPVLMVTGVMNSPEHLVTAMDEGAVDFLRKPFDRLELKARVRNMLLLADSVKELKEQNQIIARNNRLIQNLFKGVPHPLAYYNTDGIIMQHNEAFGQLVEDGGEGCIGKMIYRFFEGDDAMTHMQKDNELLDTSGMMQYEGVMRPERREFIFSKQLIVDESARERQGILCLMTEITEIKQMHTLLLEGKKRELVSSALRLIHISELNNNLISGFLQIEQQLDQEGKKIVKELVSSFNTASNAGVWQDFESRFENVYESFYQRLQEQFPDLTPGDKKLCALLRLNISSKDIAAITSQNPQSVDMARYRLRKKLNLSPEDNLVDFLLKIGQ